MIKQKTIQQLSKLLNIGVEKLRVHLAVFEKYRIPKSRPLAYYFNLQFLIELKEFYEEMSKARNYKIYYERYKKASKKLQRIINYMQI